jgi:tRNA-2-methylthio-N6-dimethylallyladenosine synthase
MKYYLKTYGCQMNVHDSEKISGIFSESGYGEAQDARKADVIVLNTCSIRQKAEQKFYRELGRLKKAKKDNPGRKVAVAGCIAQQEGDSIFKRFPYVDFVFGPGNIDNLQRWLKNSSSRITSPRGRQNIPTDSERILTRGQATALSDNPEYHTKLLPLKREGEVRAWVSIMYGCDNFCSYCVVPYTRGRERSRPVADITAEVNDIAGQGYKEITLLGQNVNSYGRKLNEQANFPDLLKALHDVNGIKRIRFVTSHPKDFSETLIRSMRDLTKVCEHLHLPLQAGSDRVLESMNRGYTYSGYKEKIDMLRDAIPGIAVTTDIIVGFPGESEEDFKKTVTALKEIEFDGIFAFKYSKRPKTRALELQDHIDEETKAMRLKEILELQDSVTYMKNKTIEGETVEVLVEGTSETDSKKMTGRTHTNKIVNFYGDKGTIGSFINIKILQAKRHSLFGEKV